MGMLFWKNPLGPATLRFKSIPTNRWFSSLEACRQGPLRKLQRHLSISSKMIRHQKSSPKPSATLVVQDRCPSGPTSFILQAPLSPLPTPYSFQKRSLPSPSFSLDRVPSTYEWVNRYLPPPRSSETPFLNSIKFTRLSPAIH